MRYASPQFVRTGVEKSLLTPRANLREMSTGQARWFERLLAELQFELCMAAEIRRKRGRKQKTDRQDAQHILGLLLKVE